MGFDRQLAAIMFTDIQGYTKLMQVSEDKAIEFRDRHRQVFDRLTEEYQGKVINYYGDGTLSIFKSAVDAVRCGCAMQQLFQQDPVIPVRIGIHMGDIVLTDVDIIGDSVNLASRVESLGVAGSVLISAKVAEEIGNKGDLPVSSLGLFHFKNDAHPREVLAMNLPGLVVPAREQLTGKLERTKQTRPFAGRQVMILLGLVALFVVGQWLWSGNDGVGIQRLAVLPFSNLMNDMEQDYLVDGIHEALISKLQLAGVSVKPRTSMLAYRGAEKSVMQISEELQVDGLLEGSVMRSGGNVSIEIRLVSGRDEEYLWGQAFEGDLSDIMFIYNDITKSIADEIQLALTPTVEARMGTTRKVDPEAYDIYLRARARLNLAGRSDVQRAIHLFQEAIDIDPQLGEAYTGLVEAYLLQGFGSVSSQEAFANFRIYAQKAIDLDERMAQDHHQRAMVKLFSEWDWLGAEEELLQAIEDHPESSAYDSYSQLMWAMGRMDRSVWAGERAVKLDSTAHFAHCDLAWAYHYAGHNDLARQQVKQTKARFGTDCPFHSTLESILAVDSLSAGGHDLSVIIDTLQARFERPEPWVAANLGWVYAMSGAKAEAIQVVEEMKRHADRDYIDPAMLARIYVGLADFDTTFDLLEEAYGQRSFTLLFTIKSDPVFEPIRADPRYHQLLTKMGLADL